MSPFEQRALDTVNRLIDKFGVVVTWNQVTDAVAGNENDPWDTTANVTEFSPKVVFLSSDRKALEFMQYVAGAEIPDGYQRALMAGNVGFTPKLKDSVVLDGKTISVKWLDPFKPAGNVLIWKMGLEP